MPTSSGNNYDADIEALQSNIDGFYEEIDSIREELDDTLTEIDTMLADWEEEQATSNSESETNTTTRWSIDCSSTYLITEVGISVYTSPSRIEEEDIYRIRLTIYNHKTSIVNNLQIDLNFTPKTGDKVFINEKNTYLDTVQSPYYWWDMDVITRGNEDYTKRISFLSEQVTVPAAVGTTWGKLILELEFNLEYQS